MTEPAILPFAVAVVALAIGCGAPPVGPSPDGGSLVFRISEITAESTGCADDPSRCARVSVTTLLPDRGGSEAVRQAIDTFLSADVTSRLRSHLPEEVGLRETRPEALAAAILAEHRAFVAAFPGAPAEWRVEIATAVLHSTPAVVTLDISEIAYTGGAHPMSRRRLVSFDVATGRLLGVDDLTRDVAGLTALVEHRLRADRGLDPDDDLEAAGFWLPDDGFRIPDNIGVTADGLLVHWDPYEIAPYSMGSFDVMVPAAELRPLVETSFW